MRAIHNSRTVDTTHTERTLMIDPALNAANQPAPQPGPSFKELGVAIVTGIPVGFLVDWPTAVQTMLTVFAGLTAGRNTQT